MPFLIKRHLCADHCTRARVVGGNGGGYQMTEIPQIGPLRIPLHLGQDRFDSYYPSCTRDTIPRSTTRIHRCAHLPKRPLNQHISPPIMESGDHESGTPSLGPKMDSILGVHIDIHIYTYPEYRVCPYNLYHHVSPCHIRVQNTVKGTPQGSR